MKLNALAFSIMTALMVCQAVCFSAAAGAVEKKDQPRAVSIKGRASATVTRSEIILSDIADVFSAMPEQDEAVIALRKIRLNRSPSPGLSKTLSAADVLERLTAEGVDLNSVSYTFPRAISVNRAARELSSEEIRSAIEKSISLAGRDAAIRDIRYENPVYIAPGESQISAGMPMPGKPGQLLFDITASVTGETPLAFKAQVAVDEWTEIPVAKRALNKGSIVGDGDVMMARLNLRTLPRDAVVSDEHVVGLETANNISYGEVFRADKLVIPPVIKMGSKVTMVYKSKLFTATATGIALESGIAGQQVKVRNDSSKSIVVGTVIEPGLVGVSP